MGLARNLSKFKPSTDGLVGAEDIANGAVTADKLGFALSSNALSQSFPLKSGTTLTAGRAVNINSSGEVGDYPVINTLGTLVTSTSAPYSESMFGNAVSTDGSRTLRLLGFGLTSGNTFRVVGTAITGTSTVTGTAVNLGSGGTFNTTGEIYAINETQFLLVYVIAANIPTEAGTTNYFARVVTVDSSGGCTLGTAISWSKTNVWPNGGTFLIIFPLPSGRFAINAYSIDSGGSGQIAWSATLSISGTTVTRTADEDMNFQSIYQTYLTSGNKLIGFGFYDNKRYYYCNYDGSTTSSYESVQLANDKRSGSDDIGAAVNANYVIYFYQKSNNDIVLQTFSINQSTGVPTLTATRLLGNNASPVLVARMLVVNSTDIVVTYRLGTLSYALSIKLNSSAEVIGTGLPLVIDSSTNNIYGITKTATTNVLRYYFNSAGFGNSRNLNVNTYSAVPWVTLGATATSQTTSPATVIVGGVCGGFTGLTPSAIYYVNENTYNGQVTTTPGNHLIGTAISSTEILLG